MLNFMSQDVAHQSRQMLSRRLWQAALPAGRDAAAAKRCSSSIAALLQQPSSAKTSIKTVFGTVRSVRKQKRIAFAAIGDGSTLKPLQAVLTPEQAEDLSTGAAVKITGQWQPSPSGKEQSYELHANEVQVLGENQAETYPIQKKYQTAEFLRTLPHLRSRIPHNALLLHLRSQVIAHITSFFASQGFVQTHPPIITSSDCEGAGEVFEVSSVPTEEAPNTNLVTESMKTPPDEPFFRAPKYLTVSSQLHLEALAQSVGKVWTLSPTFRAEKSDTPRHLSEFYMLEAEVCFEDDLDKIMDLVESMLRHVATSLQTSNIVQELCEASPDGTELAKRWQGLAHGPWPRIPYAEAIAQLQDAVAQGHAEFEFEPVLGSSLQAEHEKYLATKLGAGGPIFVTDYPRAIKAFYMSPSNRSATSPHDLDTVACFDMLVPDLCELVGGSMREHRTAQLLEAMKRHGLTQENAGIPPSSDDHQVRSDKADGSDAEDVSQSLQWYIDLRRYGSVPHGGFGLGFDRLLSYLSGVSNIRDVVAFPRWYGRCDC